MDADRLRSLRLRYLLAIGLPAAGACHEALPATGGTTAVEAAASESGSAETAARAPEFESKSVAPPLYAGKDCPVSLTRCMPGEVGAGYDGAFPECPADYVGEYFTRTRLSVHETVKARRKEPNVCCYRVERACNYDMPVVGRALRDHGVPRVAATIERHGWGARLAALHEAPAGLRAQLARHWAGEAAAEHASIAAFSLMALQLLSFGAPASLVEATHAAARDEVEHARLSFAIASFHAEATVGPDALPFPSASSLDVSLERFAIDTLLDGCVGETVAALVARESARRTVDPEISSVLARIADDEERHAELAFRALAWALERDPRIAPALRRALEGLALSGTRDAQGMLEPFGALGDEARAVVRDRALADVVRPCLEALLRSCFAAAPSRMTRATDP